MADPEKTEKKCKQFYMNLAVAMRKSLSEIDNKIETIVS